MPFKYFYKAKYIKETINKKYKVNFYSNISSFLPHLYNSPSLFSACRKSHTPVSSVNLKGDGSLSFKLKKFWYLRKDNIY